jgi:hypothetical protein
VCAIAAGKDKETKAMPHSAMAIVSSRGRLRTRLARSSSSSSSSSFPSLLCATCLHLLIHLFPISARQFLVVYCLTLCVIVSLGKFRDHEGVYLCSYWSGRYSGRQCLLGALLPRAWYPGMNCFCISWLSLSRFFLFLRFDVLFQS